MKSIVYIFVLLAILLFSCEKDSLSVYEQKLVGVWHLENTMEVNEYTKEGAYYSYSVSPDVDYRWEGYFTANEESISIFQDKECKERISGYMYWFESDSADVEKLVLSCRSGGGPYPVEASYIRID